jgi:RNA polymerase sigma factor (sigma-70 family)
MLPLDVSYDELVFLIRQKQLEALPILEEAMESKMVHYVRKTFHSHRRCALEEKDLLSLAYQTLYLAIDSYQPQRVHFDAYFHVLLERELMHAMRKYNQPHHIVLDQALSLDAEFEEGTNLYELVGEDDDRLYHQQNSPLVYLLESEDELTVEQRIILVLFQRGYSLKEIGQHIQKNYRQVARLLKQLEPLLLQHMNP